MICNNPSPRYNPSFFIVCLVFVFVLVLAFFYYCFVCSVLKQKKEGYLLCINNRTNPAVVGKNISRKRVIILDDDTVVRQTDKVVWEKYSRNGIRMTYVVTSSVSPHQVDKPT